MSNEATHSISVSHTPMDLPGVRVGGMIDGKDMRVHDLREILESAEENLARTDAALNDPAMKDLAVAIRSALGAIDVIAFHLLELHTGIYRGNLNYPEDPTTGYPGVN